MILTRLPVLSTVLAITFAAGLLAPVTVAQEPGPETVEMDEDDPDFRLPSLDPEGAQQEMVQLFHEVEQALESIDIELFDASAGRIPPPEGKESGIDRLLRSHGEKSDQAVSGIERILELAQEMGGKGGT